MELLGKAMPKKLDDGQIPEKLLSTGDIARYCHTGITQINRWIKNGDLKAFKNPGGHYRITKENFRGFLERHGMPVIEDFFKGEKKKKILIADDDTTVVDVISDILVDNYEDLVIEKAYDGYEALIIAGNFNPDILILDIRMPKIDGLEVCRRLRENKAISSSIKILAMTAHAEAYDRDKVISAGADYYLIKPVDLKTLVDYVGKLI